MRRLISFILICSLCCSVLFVPATANTAISTQNVAENWEEFLSVSESGLLIFDDVSAQNSGISNDIILRIHARVEYMNDLVRDHGGYVDESYRVVIELPSSRANGVCKVVTYVHGLTEIYMDTDTVDDVLSYISGLGNTATVVGVLALLARMTKYAAAASIIGDVATLVGGSMLVYYFQVQTAASSGRGIVMSILDDGTTATPIVGYSSQ